MIALMAGPVEEYIQFISVRLFCKIFFRYGVVVREPFIRFHSMKMVRQRCIDFAPIFPEFGGGGKFNTGFVRYFNEEVSKVRIQPVPKTKEWKEIVAHRGKVAY